MLKLITIFTFFILSSSSFAQNNYPKPTAEDIIFYIQHNRGKNTFIYQPNYKAPSLLDTENPFKISRQLFDKNGEIKPLTRMLRKYAYGIDSEKIGDNHYKFHLVSYPQQNLYLKFDKHKKPFVETTISGKYMIVKHLFIHLKNGTSGLSTKADYILFYGIDKNGKEIQTKMLF